MIPMQPSQMRLSMTLNQLSSDDEQLSQSPERLMDFQSQQMVVPISLSEIAADQMDTTECGPSQTQFQPQPRHQDTFNLLQKVNQVNEMVQKNSENNSRKEYLKELVSKQKKRYCLDGFNLDLTYITPNIIAMGFPAESFESLYRNSMGEVQRFLNTKHSFNYLVMNLCSERKYRPESFQKVVEFPFDDHNAPPFKMIIQACKTIEDWLGTDSSRIVAIHCKAGKGRTGVIICCYMLYSKQFTSAQDALKYYSMIRTNDHKGVTIASQIRYVEYFNMALDNAYNFSQQEKILNISHIILVGLPNMGIFGGCKPFIRIQNNDKEMLQKENTIYEHCCEFKFKEILVTGDVLIQFFHQSCVMESKMFQVWFNTNFVHMHQTFKRNELDNVRKDKDFKKFPENLQLEIIFTVPPENRRRSNCIQNVINIPANEAI